MTASVQSSNTAPASSAPRDFAADARRGPRDILVETRSNGDASATAAIASISDQDWHISRTHGVYHIPARAPGEPYALVTITSRGDALDLGDNRRFPFTISARDIAEDLLQDLREHGIFVCAGERPSAEELASATARRDAYYHQLISEGDTMWARGHSFREISDLHRRAAIALGVEREWAYVPTRFARLPRLRRKGEAQRSSLQTLRRNPRRGKSRQARPGRQQQQRGAPRYASTTPTNATVGARHVRARTRYKRTSRHPAQRALQMFAGAFRTSAWRQMARSRQVRLLGTACRAPTERNATTSCTQQGMRNRARAKHWRSRCVVTLAQAGMPVLL